MRVLVIDDDIGALATVRAIVEMKRPDWQADYADKPEDARNLLSANRYDVVLSDLHMPQLDAATLIAAIKTWDPAPAVVFITGYKDRCAALARDLGAATVLTKPFDIDLLIGSLEAAVSGSPGEQA